MSDQAQPMRAPPIEVVRTELLKLEPQFKMVLPSNVSVDRFVRVAITAIQMDPELLNVSRQSLFAELMKCAKDGLIPDGREAALTRYNTKSGAVAQYMPMVGGILKKIRNSGELVNMHPDIVHQNDRFRFWIDDTGPHLEHEPNWADRGEPIAAYVLTNTKSEGRYIDVLSRAEIMAVKNASKAKFGPWSGDFELEMWKKTAIRRQSKRLPMSTDLDDVMHRDDEHTDLSGRSAPALPKPESVASLEAAKGEVAPAKIQPVKKEEPRVRKEVFNHAPGAANPPPPAAEPAFDGQPDAPAPAESVPAPGPAAPADLQSRETLAAMIPAGFKKLGFTPATAADWVKKRTGKTYAELEHVEMHYLYEEMVEMAIEKDVKL